MVPLPSVALAIAGALNVVPAAYTGTLIVTDRTETRARVQTDGTAAAFDVDTAPGARIVLQSRQWEHSLGYQPRITMHDIEEGLHPPEVLHQGTLGTAWHDRFVRLAIDETATYGVQNFAYLSPEQPQGPASAQPAQPTQPTQPTPGQPTTPTQPTQPTQPTPTQPIPGAQVLPFPTSINVASSTTVLTASLRPARRWGVLTLVGYTMSGGIDAESRRVLPFQKGPIAMAAVDYAATRLDQLTTAAHASRTEFTEGDCPVGVGLAAPQGPPERCAPQNDLFDAVQTWHHAWSHQVETTATGGLGLAHTRKRPSDPYEWKAYPVADVQLSDRFRGRDATTVVLLRASYAPVVNRVTGLIDARATVGGEVRWTRDRTTLRGTATGSQSVPTNDPLSVIFVQGEGAVIYRLGKGADLEAGERLAWQKQYGLSAAPLLSVTYLALTLRAPALRF